MKPSFNQIELMGTIEGEVRTRQNGERATATFHMVTTGTARSASGEPDQVAYWHKVSLSRTNMDLIQKLEAGTHIFVFGTLRTQIIRSEAGHTCISADVLAHQIKLLGHDDFEGHSLPIELDELPMRTTPKK